jgi:hypothetical protein
MPFILRALLLVPNLSFRVTKAMLFFLDKFPSEWLLRINANFILVLVCIRTNHSNVKDLKPL